MAFDYPASPTTGQLFTPPGANATYKWDGSVWNLLPWATSTTISVGDQPPSNPAVGQLWWKSSTGVTYIWYNDGNTSQWVQIANAGRPPSFNTARARNRVNNPTAQVTQENGNNVVTSAGSYPADQWFWSTIGITASGQRVSLNPPSPEGTNYAVAMTATTAKASLAAGDLLFVVVPMEGNDVSDLVWGGGLAQQVVLRFCAICDTPGTYGVAIRNGATNRTWLGSFTIAQAGVSQVFYLVIPGDTTGTWAKDNTLGIQVSFAYAAGSNFIGVAGWQAGNFVCPPGCSNGAAVANAKLSITDVGFYADPDKTGIAPPFNAPSYEDDLFRCMRYWERLDGTIFGGYWSAASYTGAHWMFKALKRVAPTINYISGTSANRYAPSPSFCEVLNDANAAATIMGNSTASARMI